MEHRHAVSVFNYGSLPYLIPKVHIAYRMCRTYPFFFCLPKLEELITCKEDESLVELVSLGACLLINVFFESGNNLVKSAGHGF